MLEEAEVELGLEDAADGVVDPCPADPSGVDLSKQQLLELLGAEGLHEHVGAGVHSDSHLVRGQATNSGVGGVGNLVNPLPVRDDETVEVVLTLEHVGDQLLVRVHLDRVAHPVFDPVDTGERRHDAAHAVPPDRRRIGRQIDLRELVPTRHRDALVDRVTLQVPRQAHVGGGGRVVVLGVAVTRIVLRGGQDMVG